MRKVLNPKTCRSGLRSRKTQIIKRKSRSVVLTCTGLESRTVLTTGLQTMGIVPGELLVQYKSGFNVQQRAMNRVNAGVDLAEEIADNVQIASGAGTIERLSLPDNLSIDSAKAWFARQPGVAYAEPNYWISATDVSNDPYYTSGRLWNMEGSDSPVNAGPAGTTNPNGINAEAAWQSGHTGSNSVVVGIVDTGIQTTHPELADNIWVNPFDAPDGIDNDGNGYVDDVNGWDFVNNDNSVYDGLTDGHGTHVAGIIGAKGGNGVGVAGVDWNVSMISAKFMSATGGTTADAVKAIDYLTDLKVRHGINLAAINTSWGSDEYSQALQDAILRSAKSDILLVAAAGNDHINNDATPFYPASYSTLTPTANESAASYDSVISVTSIASDGGLAYYSNTGPTSVDIAAPGSSIISTVPNNSYAIYSGTSMATPHVTGAIALYAATHPGTSAADIKSAILGSARPSQYLAGKSVTGGVLDVNAALAVDPPARPDIAQITISNTKLQETNSGTTVAEFTVALNKVSSAPVTVQYATSDGTATAGSDYVASSGTITIAPGQTTATVQVTVNGDTTVEGDETFSVKLTNASSNAVISRDLATGTILNDDVYVPEPTQIFVSDTSMAEGNRGLSWMTFAVSRTGNLNVASSFAYYTSPGTAMAFSDFLPGAGIVRFNPGESSKVISVRIYGDVTKERDETFSLNLGAAINARLASNKAVGTILDDDGGTTAASVRSSSVKTSAGNSPSSTVVEPKSVTIPIVSSIASNKVKAQAIVTPRPLPVIGPRPGGPARPKHPVRPI